MLMKGHNITKNDAHAHSTWNSKYNRRPLQGQFKDNIVGLQYTLECVFFYIICKIGFF